MDESHIHVEQKKPFDSIYLRVKSRTMNPRGHRGQREWLSLKEVATRDHEGLLRAGMFYILIWAVVTWAYACERFGKLFI